LRDLNLAHNEISTIKSEALQSLVKLETLNLSGNLGLARLSDVLALRGLRSLATLRFQDPSFHSAPLSELENYQTYCIHHLPSLKQLDALKILPAIRTSVEAALIKKNMFYSMRRETIRYNQQMICDVIERVFKDRIQPLLDEIPVRGRGDESNGLLMQARRWDRVKQKLVHFVNRYAESRQKMLRAELHSCGFQNFQVERVGDVSADIDWAVDGVGSDKEVYGISYRVIANRKTADEVRLHTNFNLIAKPFP
jgi:hypothetical protein